MQYFGGKQRISTKISDYIATHTHTHTHYAEPFCGSCNVASKVTIKNKTLNDKHKYLIEMFKELQNGWIPPEVVSCDDYYDVKNNPDDKPYLTGFVGFACSFAGKWFGGYARDSKGVDKVEKYALRGKNSILKKMTTLKDAKFINKDFLDLDFKDTLIYCDPPYRNTTQYNKKLLGEFPYDSFIQWVREQSKNNTVLVSEYKHNVPDDAEIVLELKSRTSIRGGDGNVIDTTEVLWRF